MNEIATEVSTVIEAGSKHVYFILADYPGGHYAILPKEYFTDFSVIEGGQGAGTVIDIGMSVMGIESRYRFNVSEPEPGRVLMEADEDAGVVTTFTADPVDGDERSRVTITTRARASQGLRGLIERLVNPAITRRIYRKELQILASYARKGKDQGP